MNKKLLAGIMSGVMLAGSCSSVGAQAPQKITKVRNSVVNFVKGHKKSIVGGTGLVVAAAAAAVYFINNARTVVIDFNDEESANSLKSKLELLDEKGSIVVMPTSKENVKKVLNELKGFGVKTVKSNLSKELPELISAKISKNAEGEFVVSVRGISEGNSENTEVAEDKEVSIYSVIGDLSSHCFGFCR